MKTLSQIRGQKKVVFTFGRMNPPTRGHQKVIEKILEIAKQENAEPRIYLSFSQDPKKNPLTQKQKLKYIKLGIPECVDHLIEDPRVRNPFEALTKLQEEGFTDVIMVVGEDRVKEFKSKIHLDHPDKNKNYFFESVKVISAGKRDEKLRTSEGISASKMRKAAEEGDFEKFKTLSPSKLSERFSREMYDLVRTGLRIAEEVIKLKNTLNIPRKDMPQIRNDDIRLFIKDLEQNGIGISKKDISIAKLKPTQKEVSVEKIKTKINDFLTGESQIKPFIVSIDNYILDGHHQLYALKDIDNKQKVAAYVVDIKMEDLLQYAHEFPSVTYKKIHE